MVQTRTRSTFLARVISESFHTLWIRLRSFMLNWGGRREWFKVTGEINKKKSPMKQVVDLKLSGVDATMKIFLFLM